MKISIDGLEIGYDSAGEGRPVVFLHGWGVDRSTFKPVADRIADCCRAITVDLPGFGESEEPQKPFNTDDFADFTEHFIAALGLEKPVLCGHSNGGKTALALTGRGYQNLSKLVLVSSTGIPPKHKPGFYIKRFLFKTGKKLLHAPVIGKPFSKIFDPSKYGSEDYKKASPMMKKTMSAVLSQDVSGRLKNIAVPTLLFWGDRDTATPLADGEKMKKLIPDAGLIVYRGCDHYAFLHRLPEFTAALRYFILN